MCKIERNNSVAKSNNQVTIRHEMWKWTPHVLIRDPESQAKHPALLQPTEAMVTL
jgi:hypothetical protein